MTRYEVVEKAHCDKLREGAEKLLAAIIQIQKTKHHSDCALKTNKAHGICDCHINIAVKAIKAWRIFDGKPKTGN